MKARITTYYHEDELAYTSLYSHFAYLNFGVAGDSIVSFIGPCDVSGERLVDLEDRRAGSFIKAAKMLHFVIEHFGIDLLTAVRHQRILCACLLEELYRAGVPGLRREGDDLFAEDGKLTVSVASVSPVSALIHLGVNVNAAGAPVRTAELASFPGVDPRALAVKLVDRYAQEVNGIWAAAAKVRPVQ